MMKVMNKIVYISIAVTSIFAYSCSKNAEFSQDGRREITINVLKHLETPTTKAQWEDGEGFTWDNSEGSLFGLFSDDGSCVQSTSASVTDKSISVTASVPGEANKVFLFYPYPISYNRTPSTSTPNTWMGMLDMENQTQAVAGSMSFDDESGANGNIILVSKKAIDLSKQSSPYTVSMVPLFSMVRFLIYDSVGSDASVKSVTITADAATQKLNGQEQVTFNYSSDTYSFIHSAAGTLSNKVTLTEAFSLTGVTSASKSKGIYMSVLPTTITGYTITVKMTDETEYTFRAGSDVITFSEGKLINIPIDLQNAGPRFTVDAIVHNVSSDVTSENINVTAFKASWTAEVISGAASISPSSGSSSGTITVSFAANEDTENDKEYVVRVSTTADVTQKSYDVTITQNKAGFSGYMSFAKITSRNTNYSFTYNTSGVQNLFYAAVQISLDGETGWSTIEANVDESYYTGISATVIDNATGIAADWCSVYRRSADSWMVVNLTENTGAERSATVTVSYPVEANGYRLLDGEGTFVFTISQSAYVSPAVLSYTDAKNLWKAVDDASEGVRFFYYGPEIPGENEGTSLSFVSKPVSSTYQVNLEKASGGRWSNQFFMHPETGHFIGLEASKTYSFKVTISSSSTFTGYFKLCSFNNVPPKYEGGAIWDKGEIALAAGSDLVLQRDGITGITCDNINLIFDFGGNPAGTTILIKEIIIEEQE